MFHEEGWPREGRLLGLSGGRILGSFYVAYQMPQSLSSWMSAGAETTVLDWRGVGQLCRVGCQGGPGEDTRARSDQSVRRPTWEVRIVALEGTSTEEKTAGLGWPTSCNDGAARLCWPAAAREKGNHRIIVSTEEQQQQSSVQDRGAC